MTEPPVLEIGGLAITVAGRALVEDLSLRVDRGEMVGLVGESGCGKSVTALSVMKLLPPSVRLSAGSIRYRGQDLQTLPEESLRELRGNRIAMIFQEPATSLNPVFTIGDQIAEALIIHRGVSRTIAREAAGDLLDLVGIPAARRQLDRYPHHLSGGQRQRVMIATALACEPDLLIADEPTTALDVTVQAQILSLIDRLRRERGMACLLITHDFGVVAEICDRVAVMYAGRIVETAPVVELFARPRHRYTQALLATMPAANLPGNRLPAITGSVPPPGQREKGCAFQPRCTASLPRCAIDRPPDQGETHRFACWNPT